VITMPSNKVRVAAFEAKTLTWWKSRRSKIDMHPVYQRRGRLWSDTDKAYLIDSIINGFDIPKLYIADFTYGDSSLNRKKLPYAIIDGKQRLEAIFNFFDGFVTLNPDFVLLENPSLPLGGLSYLDLLNNHAEIAEAFDNYNLSVMSVITDSDELINELFVRLNRSKPLTGAEIRNAMSGPAPEVIRKLSRLDFFTNNCSFPIARGQDLNAAAKILMFEFHEAPHETKKTALDTFVRESAQQRQQLELAGRRAYGALGDLATIFLPKDRLLSSAGIIPVYYWFFRQVKPKDYTRVRRFLARFEELRKNNRGASDSAAGARIAKQLAQYDQLNRSTNDLTSHHGRVSILLALFAAGL
jgi:hypothetical protein